MPLSKKPDFDIKKRRTTHGRTWGESPTRKANARRHVAHATVMRAYKKYIKRLNYYGVSRILSTTCHKSGFR